MKFLASSSIFALAASAAVLGPRQDQAAANCKLVSFTVNGAAPNRNLTGITMETLQDLQKLKTFYNSAKFIVAQGSQTIAGTYCAPTVTNSNNAKLQVFFNSIGATRGTWQGSGGLGTNYPAYLPEKYSWTQFANKLGYGTLALDRLGEGCSSRPDPINIVQAPYEAAIYSDLAKQLRNTNTQFQKYNFLIYVGNSYGSQVGVTVAGAFPSAYDEYVLTGYSRSVDPAFTGIGLQKSIPARQAEPTRFGDLDPGYLASSVQTASTNSFFGSKQQVSYEDIVARYFYERRDVVSIGQLASIYAFPFSGSAFKGRVLVLTGEQDQAFCGPGSSALGPASCGDLLAQTKSVFPNAQYSWKSVNSTGHAIQLCNSAKTVFAVAHFFLAGANFAGGTPA